MERVLMMTRNEIMNVCERKDGLWRCGVYSLMSNTLTILLHLCCTA
jgi:hypothetical protein